MIVTVGVRVTSKRGEEVRKIHVVRGVSMNLY